MSSINIILGAGFSRPAEFPTGNQLNQKFFKSMENKMLRWSSGEWIWDEYDSATSNNGRLNYDYLNISYLLSEFVEKYQASLFRVFDYEEFFDWFRENYGNNELISELSDKANTRLKSDFGINDKSHHILKNPGINEYSKIYDTFNYLIGDLLGRKYKSEEKKDFYQPFINYIKNWDEVKIFTLNHDLLLEYLFKEYKIKYSDGFSKEESFIVGEQGEPLEYFKNSYIEKIKLFKIHGSIEYYRFDELIEEGLISHRTGDYWFFKPENYYNKHYAKRIDIKSGEVIQKYNWNTVPQFLTGKNKMDFINNQHFYGDLYKEFNNSFTNCDELLLIGYSFSDLHINSVIKISIDSKQFSIININPRIVFPFRKDYKTDSIKNLNSIEEL